MRMIIHRECFSMPVRVLSDKHFRHQGGLPAQHERQAAVLSSQNKLSKSFAHHLPINDAPQAVQMFGTAIFIIEIVSMLPHIKAQDGASAGSNGVATAGLLQNDECAVGILRQPHPPGAKESRATLFELLAEVLKTSPLCLDGLCQTTGGLPASGWGKLLEIEIVVEHLPGIVKDNTGGMTHNVFQRFAFILRAFHQTLQGGGISSQVLAMVQFNGAPSDDGSERIGGIGQLHQPPRACLRQRNCGEHKCRP